MTLFEIMFIPTVLGAIILGYLSVKNNWKIAEFF